MLLGCTRPYEPPPDNESGGSTWGGEDEGEPFDDSVVHDGGGRGVLLSPRRIDGRGVVVIGAPGAIVDQVSAAGQLAILVDSGSDEFPPHAPPLDASARIAEDHHDPSCATDQRFAWELSADRRLGSALSYHGFGNGGGHGDWGGVLVASAAAAATGSGRVLLYPDCRSCALFPRPEGDEKLLGGRFGAAVAVGFFGDPEHPDAAFAERLVVGAPDAGDGVVAVLDEDGFRRWDWTVSPGGNTNGMLEGIRECACELDPDGPSDCRPWAELLEGSFDDEQFGAALAVADFDCDGSDDLAVGAPGATLPGQGGAQFIEAGAAYVFSAAPPELAGGYTILRQGTPEVGGEPEDGDRFGEVLIAGNFNGARMLHAGWSCFDLVVGTPGEDGEIGEIQIFEGSPDGLTFTGPILRLEDFGLVPASGDRFGHAMTVGDFDQNGYDDLVIGMPGYGVGGGLIIVPGEQGGLNSDLATAWTQPNDTDEPGDDAGWALSWTWGDVASARAPFLVIGVPGEDADTGAILLHRLSWTRGGMFAVGGQDVWFQDEFGGAATPGDRFGETLMPPRAMPKPPWGVP